MLVSTLALEQQDPNGTEIAHLPLREAQAGRLFREPGVIRQYRVAGDEDDPVGLGRVGSEDAFDIRLGAIRQRAGKWIILSRDGVRSEAAP